MKNFEKETKKLCKQFSSNFKKLLKHKNITVHEFCLSTKESLGNGSNWWHGKSIPGKKKMIKLCNFFNYYDVYSLLTTDIDLKIKKSFFVIPNLKFSLRIFSYNYKLLLSLTNTNCYSLTGVLFGNKKMKARGGNTRSWKGISTPKWSVFIALCEYFRFYNIYQLLTEEIDISHVLFNWEKISSSGR